MGLGAAPWVFEQATCSPLPPWHDDGVPASLQRWLLRLSWLELFFFFEIKNFSVCFAALSNILVFVLDLGKKKSIYHNPTVRYYDLLTIFHSSHNEIDLYYCIFNYKQTVCLNTNIFVCLSQQFCFKLGTGEKKKPAFEGRWLFSFSHIIALVLGLTMRFIATLSPSYLEESLHVTEYVFSWRSVWSTRVYREQKSGRNTDGYQRIRIDIMTRGAKSFEGTVTRTISWTRNKPAAELNRYPGYRCSRTCAVSSVLNYYKEAVPAQPIPGAISNRLFAHVSRSS